MIEQDSPADAAGTQDPPDAASAKQAPGETKLPKAAVGAAMSKMISATVGDIAVVMSRAPARKHFTLADIEWLILPPVIARQVYVAEASSKESGFRAPVAVVTWAKVSDEVDQRLTEMAGKQPVRLRPDEWSSGDIYWIIDMLGDPRGIGHALKQLLAGPFKETDVKVAARDGAGLTEVKYLTEIKLRGRDPVVLNESAE